MNVELPRTPRFCRHCGAPLPVGSPRFCIECGGEIYPPGHAPPEPPPTVSSSAGQPTVRLANARSEQTVVGGTIRLPTDQAFPPGLWFADDPPGSSHVVAVYTPLRAVVGGWSGLVGKGWKRGDGPSSAAPFAAQTFRFITQREWFAAPHAARSLSLQVTIEALAEASEGRRRDGFRYRVGHDAPMQVVQAHWVDRAGQPDRGVPVPQIQLMAPPRVPRISDLDEQIALVAEPQALEWARQGVIGTRVQMIGSDMQQRTPVGRGLVFAPERLSLGRIFGRVIATPIYYLRLTHPITIERRAWDAQRRKIAAEAQELGLDLGTDATIEWWLDRQGHDGAILNGFTDRYPQHARVVVAFRRSQVAKMIG